MDRIGKMALFAFVFMLITKKAFCASPIEKNKKTLVLMETTIGNIKIELEDEKAPITVKNFLEYIKSGFYEGTIFHRVIPGFVVQGGGFSENMVQKPTRAPIKNEANNGLINARGTLSMARTNNINSATSQFFINLKDNPPLDHQNEMNYGYAVFGRVIEGMDVVDSMANIPTTTKGFFQDVPTKLIVIKSAKVIK